MAVAWQSHGSQLIGWVNMQPKKPMSCLEKTPHKASLGRAASFLSVTPRVAIPLSTSKRTQRAPQPHSSLIHPSKAYSVCKTPCFASMTDSVAGQSSYTEPSDAQEPHRPDTRSRVYVKPLDLQNPYPELYYEGQQVYVHGRRGSDLNPYTVYMVLGNGQYKLKRDNRVENRIYMQAQLKTYP